MADVNISSSSAPQTVAPPQKAVPSYKLRTMASDLEALKKGIVPKAFSILEKTDATMPSVNSIPAVHSSIAPANTPNQLNIKETAKNSASVELRVSPLLTPISDDASINISVTSKPKPAFPEKILTPSVSQEQSFNTNIPVKPVASPKGLPIASTHNTPSVPVVSRLNPPISLKVSKPHTTKEPFSMPIGKPFQTMPPAKAPLASQSQPLTMPTPAPMRPLTPPPPQVSVAHPIIPSSSIKPLTPLRPLTPMPTPKPLAPEFGSMTPRSFTPSTPSQPQAPLVPIKPPMPPTPLMAIPVPPLPPLPAIPALPPLPNTQTISKPKKSKIIILALLTFIVLVFIGGEIWWFFLREQSQITPATGTSELLPEPSVENMNNLLPPPPESTELPITPISESSASTETPNSLDLLAFDRSEVLTVDSSDSTAIIKATSNLNSLSLKEDELVKITLQSTSTPAQTLIFNDIADALKLKLPQTVKAALSDGNFNLFVFGANSFDKDTCRANKNNTPACSGPRLGLVFEPSQSSGLASALRSWEKTLVNDLKSLILAKTGSPASATFHSGTYNNQSLRYKNLPLNTVTIDYALVDNVFIITTSKSSMLRAIDALK